MTARLASASFLVACGGSSTPRPGDDDLPGIDGGGQEMGKGVVGMAVLDAAGTGIEGAEVSSTPAAARYRYMESNGFPSSSATATAADGVAFMFSVPPGQVTITATKSGLTF